MFLGEKSGSESEWLLCLRAPYLLQLGRERAGRLYGVLVRGGAALEALGIHSVALWVVVSV